MRIDRPLILLVEDSKTISEILQFLLEAEGFSIIKLSDSTCIQKEVYKNSPNIVLMDMLLLNSNGCDACRNLKMNEDMINLPIIMMSAHPDGKKECLAAGADDFIEKPFETIDLVNLLYSNLSPNI